VIFLDALPCVSTGAGNKAEPKKPNMVLWYNEPAANWNEALPLGNGRMGAMVFGGVFEEHLQLNENTLYSGEPSQSYKNVNVSKDLDNVLKLLHGNENLKADEYIRKNWLGKLHVNYQPLGDLFSKINTNGRVNTYTPELDIANSLLRITYQTEGVEYKREMFASHPDSVIVIKFSASKPVINLVASFSSVHPTAKTTVKNGILCLTGQAPGYSSRRTPEQIELSGEQYKHPALYDSSGKRKFEKSNLYGDEIEGKGTFFEAQIKAKLTDGNLEMNDSSIYIKNSSNVVFVLSAATSFNGFDKSPSLEGVDPAKFADRILKKAVNKS